MQNQLFSISQAAKFLGVSIDALRRWDKSGRLVSIRTGPRGHRFYRQSDINLYLQNIEAVARAWSASIHPTELNSRIYCQTRDVFQGRLETLQSQLSKIMPIEKVSLITAIAGEIGNNSFDHNLGNWPDIPGIFFSYSFRDREIVLSDRGQGILKTLKRVRPHLVNSKDALKVAFTETISGRYPEARGNGLKFVRAVIVKNPFTLYFQTDNAKLYLKIGSKKLHIKLDNSIIRGCFAIIGFDERI